MARDMTIKEVATRLGVHPESVRRWLRDEVLIGYRLGLRGGWRIREEDLQKFIRERMNITKES